MRSLRLTERERSLLMSWLESPALTTTMERRVRIVLASADGHSVRATARKLGLSADTVFVWRRRFQAERLQGLRSRALPGRPRRVEPLREEAIRAAGRPRGRGRTTPTAAAVARASGVSRTTVRRLWREEMARTSAASDREDGSARGPDGDAAREGGTIVGIVLGIMRGRPFRLMARVPRPTRKARAARDAPEAGSPAGRTRRREVDPDAGAAGPRTILTALEGFSPRIPPRGRDEADDRVHAALASFFDRLAHPRLASLEVAGEPWRPRDDNAWSWLTDERRGRWRLLRPRTRGEWLATVGRWMAAAPMAQAPALAGALGHLTDYFATWTHGSAPFVWTAGFAGGDRRSHNAADAQHNRAASTASGPS